MAITKSHTNLGTPELHRRSKVMLEGGPVPRAKVLDQHLIDAFLLDGLLNLPQFRAGEFLLGQTVTAKMYPSSADVSSVRVQGGQNNYIPFGVQPYSRTLQAVERRYGEMHTYVLNEVIVHEWDIRSEKSLMRILRDSLDWVFDRVLHRPVRIRNNRPIV